MQETKKERFERHRLRQASPAFSPHAHKERKGERRRETEGMGREGWEIAGGTEKRKEKKRGRKYLSPTFTPQMCIIVKAGPSRSQKSRPSPISMCMPRTQVLEPSSVCLPWCILAGSWIGLNSLLLNRGLIAVENTYSDIKFQNLFIIRLKSCKG